MALQVYHPEMGETRPTTNIEARLMSYGGGWLVKSEVELNGRGVTLRGVLRADQLHEKAQHKAGWFEYRVTKRAMESLKAKFDIAVEALL